MLSLGITFLLDAPCGDLTWIHDIDVDYAGADIVSDLLDRNRQLYPMKSFFFLDLADSTAPQTLTTILQKADASTTLILCRHLLFHLPPDDGRTVLSHLIHSGARWLLTSTYLRADDLAPSDDDDDSTSFVLANGFHVNLFRPPFCAPDPLRLYRDASYDQFLALFDLHAWAASSWGNDCHHRRSS